jgi:hypothetical protein
MDIASAAESEEPGSNQGYNIFMEIIATLLFTIDVIFTVGVLKREVKALARKY